MPTTTIQVKNAEGDIIHLKGSGAGTDLDPFVPVQNIKIQDQTTPILCVPFHLVENTTTFAVDSVINTRSFTVTDPTGFTIGKFASFFSISENRFGNATITDVVGSVITIDSPLDFAYLTGDTVTSGTENLAVDGSVTPVKFQVRTGDPGLSFISDITRLVFTMETVSTPVWTDFGDIINGLTRGVVLRRTDGITTNIFNIKSNSDLAGICYDLTILSGQGLDGIRARMSFAGASKMGVVLRVAPNEDLEIIIQDDLTSLGDFRIRAQGHISFE
jgi:hypothetical protein